MQTTIAKSLAFSGIGLHGGRPVRMTLRPGPVGSGVRFCRVDLTDRDQMIPAAFDAVVDTRLCTVLGNADGATVSTVEHLMAAVGALGVDNLLVDVDGPELPIMDGSSQPFLDAILAVGLTAQAGPRRALRVLQPVSVERGDARATLRPSDVFEVAFEIAFDDAAIGRQSHAVRVTPTSFAAELAECRTFVRMGEIEALRAAGLAKGGGLHNAIVVDGARVLNPGGLRRADEFVRHKALDAVGDLALAGAPILGAYTGVRAGHALTNLLLRALFARPDAWRWEPATERDDLPTPLATRAPALIAAE